METIGYVVCDVTGKLYMTRNYDFGTMKYEPNPFVFNEDELSKIKQDFTPTWNVHPVYKKKATWSELEGTKIIGKLEAFWDVEE